MHFCTSFIREYVSPVCQGTHQVSEDTTLSLFLHTQISKNGATTEPIIIWIVLSKTCELDVEKSESIYMFFILKKIQILHSKKL